MKRGADLPLFIVITTLAIGGFIIFLSAAMGLLARSGGGNFQSVVLKQLAFMTLGAICGLVLTRIPYKLVRPYTPHILAAGALMTVLVFVPHIGFRHGGAARWLSLGPLSIQPSEFLKFGVLLYLAAWLSAAKASINTLKGLIPFGVVIAGCVVLLLAEPDLGTLCIILVTAGAMLFSANISWRIIGIIALCAVLGLGGIIAAVPYARERVTTYMDASQNALGSSYQVEQSLIAIGSGGVFGQGFGQGIEKFDYLPEPVGDSIFAVYTEEFGLLGALVLIGLLVFFAIRGLKIASGSSDLFGRYLAVGIVAMLITQSFLNIGSALSVIPFTGEPLAFVSQGGTALLFAFIEAGILLNISKYQRKPVKTT